MYTVKFKWFNAKKGYGSSKPDDGSQGRLSCTSRQSSARQDNLAEGHRSPFEIDEGQRGKTSAVKSRTSVIRRRSAEGC